MDGNRKGSLLSLIDQTRTSMGGRLLKSWLLAPLRDQDLLRQRQDAVERLRATFAPTTGSLRSCR